MARGNGIVVRCGNIDKQREWGYVTGTPKPGTIIQIDASVALKHGKHTWKAYDQGADGDRPAGPFAVLDHQQYTGQTADTAITSGDFCQIFIPLPGDELNLLFLNVGGTADDVALGDKMIVDDGTGKVTVTASTPETEIAVALEAIVDPSADQLLWCCWSGY